MTQPPSSAMCPVHFDPFTSPYLDDPYQVFPALLAEAGPRYWPEMDYWLVAHHDQVEAVFKDADRFSASIVQDPLQAPHPDAAAILAQGFRPLKTMSNLDGPEHTRIRRHNQVGFRPRRLKAMEPVIRDLAVSLIDALPTGAQADLVQADLVEADLVQGLTHPLPAAVVFNLLGFPPQDTPMLKGWCGDRMAFSWGRPDREAQVQIARDMVSYWQYCEAHVAGQLADPGDHFTGDLLRIHLADPSALSVAEITSVVYGLSFAGHETTTNLLSNTIRRLLEDRHQWEAILADPSGIEAVVAEGVRHDSSVVAWRRLTTTEVTIGDVTIPAGSRLLLLLGAANHDPARFAEPDAFDPRRPNATDALSFGFGKHFCLGATLAKLEVAVVLEELTARRPGLRLVPQELRFNPNVSFRGPRELWVSG